MGKMVAELPEQSRRGLMWLKASTLSLLSLTIVVAIMFGWLQSSSSTAFSQTADYSLKWEVSGAPTQGRVGLQMTFASVKITNTGNQKWLSSGTEAVRLGYRWFSTDNQLIPATGDTAWEDLRAALPSDIPPGGSVIFPDFQVAVPIKAGDYLLHLDLVQGISGWFATKGASDYPIRVTVLPKDTTSPTATIAPLPLFQVSTVFTLTWSGTDDKDGSGIANYDLQYKALGDPAWTDWLQGTTQTSASFSGDNGKVYLFRVRATDKAGNTGSYPDNAQTSTRINILPPTARIDTLEAVSPTAFLVRWSGFDSVDGSDNQLFDVQFKDGDNGSWQDWQNATPGTAAVFQGVSGHTYYFRCRATNYAGQRSEYSDTAQASTTVNQVLDSLYTSQVPVTVQTTTITSTATVTATTTPASSLTASVSVSETSTPSVTVTSSVGVSGTVATGTAVTPSLTVTASVGVSDTVSNVPSSTTPALPALTTTATAAPTVTSTTPAAAGPQTSIFPLAVKNGDASLGTTGIVIQNSGSDALDVFVRFSDQKGAPITTTVNGASVKTSPDQAQTLSRVATVLVTVPPMSSQTVWTGNLAVSAYNGWATLTASGPFQATAVRLPKAGQSVEYVPATAASTLYLPYLKKAGTTSSSYINLANPNATPADIEITYYDASSGQVVATEKHQLAMLGSTRLSLAGLSLSGSATTFNGSAVISASVPVAASIELPQVDGSVATYNALTKTGNVVSPLVFYKNTSDVSSALLVQNTAKVPTSVKVEYLDESGATVGSVTKDVAGNGSVVVGQDGLKDQNSFSGRVRVSVANGSIAAIAVGGSSQLQAANQQFP